MCMSALEKTTKANIGRREGDAAGKRRRAYAGAEGQTNTNRQR